MDKKFFDRELKISFFLATIMGLKNPTIEILDDDGDEVVTVENKKGLVIFNPFTSKQNFFEVYMWALSYGINVNAFRQNIAVKNTKTDKVIRRAFENSDEARTNNIIECIAIIAGYKE